MILVTIAILLIVITLGCLAMTARDDGEAGAMAAAFSFAITVVATIVIGTVVISYSVRTPVLARALTNEHEVLQQAITTPESNLSTATVLRLVDFNARVINWRRWEKSLLIGMFYADLPEEVKVLQLPS